MNKVNLIKGAVTAGTLAPYLAMAQLTGGDAGGFGDFVNGLIDLVNNFLIPLFIAIAVLMFIYGVFVYFIQGGADEEKRAQGRSLMLYAIIGFVAIVALWGIVVFVAAAFGFQTGAAIPGFPTGPSS